MIITAMMIKWYFVLALKDRMSQLQLYLKGSLWSLIGVRNKNNYSEDTFVHNLGVFAHIQLRAPDICVRFGPNVISCTWHRLGEAFCGTDVTHMSVHTSHLAYINWTWSSNQSYLSQCNESWSNLSRKRTSFGLNLCQTSIVIWIMFYTYYKQ